MYTVQNQATGESNQPVQPEINCMGLWTEALFTGVSVYGRILQAMTTAVIDAGFGHENLTPRSDRSDSMFGPMGMALDLYRQNVIQPWMQFCGIGSQD